MIRKTKTKKGKLFLVVGFTGVGKTFTVKELIKKVKNPVIFDVNNEYGYPQYYGKNLPKIDDWLGHVNTNVRDSVVVIDEATIFFNMKNASQKLTEMLVRKRHTGNTYFLNFHFLSSVPNHILAFANAMILFQTGERQDLVEKKYKGSEIYYQYLQLINHHNKHEKRFIKLMD